MVTAIAFPAGYLMRVLLTGASGFLGAHALKYLLAETDWDFICPVTFRHKGVPERITWAVDDDFKVWSAFGGRVNVVRHDLAAPVNAQTAHLFGAIDLIINFASDTHPPRSVTHPVEFVHNNVDISLYLLEYARSLDPMPTVVQISTNSVYGPALDTSSHPEWDAIIPNNPYGASKAFQEALAISYWRSYNLPVILVNTMNPMAETQDIEKFIPMTIGKVLRGEQVEIHAGSQGEIGMRTFIDAPEMVAGLLHILRLGHPTMRDSGADRPDRWHVAGLQETTNLQIAQLIADELGTPLNYILSTVDRPEHGHRYSLSPAKLIATGWQPSPSIEAAIRRTARWTAEHPLWLV